MMFHVKWFLLVPCVVNMALAVMIGGACGNALSSGDIARALVLLAATALFGVNSAVCGMWATRS